MSKADEMFEKLGYKKKEEKNYIRYNNFGDKYFGEVIDFDLKNKKFRLTNKTCQGNTHFRYGSMQELQAINEKVKELRMELEEAKKTLQITKNVTNNYRIQEAIETVLNYIENSISKEVVKKTIEDNAFEVHTREYGNLIVVSEDCLYELLEGK